MRQSPNPIPVLPKRQRVLAVSGLHMRVAAHEPDGDHQAHVFDAQSARAVQLRGLAHVPQVHNGHPTAGDGLDTTNTNRPARPHLLAEHELRTPDHGVCKLHGCAWRRGCQAHVRRDAGRRLLHPRVPAAALADGDRDAAGPATAALGEFPGKR